MAAPQWITNAGSLGIAIELEPFSVDLAVQTGDARAQFSLISGQLPPGLRLSPRGNVSGYPIGKLSGVPLAVNEEIVFTFVVRCTNERGELSDRTFSITVTGEDAPIPLIAPYANNSLGSFNDGEWIEISVAATDTDPNDTLTYRIVSGDLPTGLTLDTNLGVISGYIEPGIFILESLGFDTDNFDTVGFAQEQSLSTRTYSFEIQIDDKKSPVIAAYSITVNKVDNHVPILLNRSTDIGTVLDENYFFHKFEGRDFDSDALGYEILPIVRYPTIVGTQVYPVITANANLTINGENIVTSGNTVTSVAQDINSAATRVGNLTNITSEVRNGKLLIFSTGVANSTITIGNTTVATELGITANVYNRNVNDTNLDITQDIAEIIPPSLQLNSETGWLYGFIDPLSVGEKTYDFYLRLYQTNSEPGNATITVDYASDFPFSVVNNKTQDNLDELGLDADNTDYINKTIIFAQQESFDATYTGLDGTTFTTGASDGWLDPNAVLIPGYSSTPNKRGGVWKFVKSVDRTVTTGNTAGNTKLTLSNVYTLTTGMSVSGTNIATNTVISSINTTSNVITLNSAITGTVTANSIISFNSSNYQLDFTQTVSGNTVVNVGRYTTTGNTGYTQPGVKLYYETAATPPNTVPRYVTANVNANSALWPQRLTVTSSNNYQITWLTDSDLGSLTSGVPSSLSVTAVNQAQTAVIYQMAFSHPKTVFGNFNQSTVIRLRDVEGIVVGMKVRTADQNYTTSLPIIVAINSDLNQIQISESMTLSNDTVLECLGTDLPRGLTLTSNGEIQGRVSHQHWKLNDNTTFDSNQTSFDRTYIVPIRAVSYLNDPEPRQIESIKTFKFVVKDFKDKPSMNLYLDFLLEDADRQTIYNALFDTHLIPDNEVYRASDHWYGRQSRLKMLVAYGLDTASADAVMQALVAYHHKKRYKFTELKWAQSLNENGEVEYEVIYIQPVDFYTTNSGAQLTGKINVKNLYSPLYTDSEPLAEDTSLYDSTTDYVSAVANVSGVSGTNVISINGSTEGIYVGMKIDSPSISSSSKVITVNESNVVMSLNNIATISGNVTFYDNSVGRYTYLYPASLPNMQTRLRSSLTPNNRKFLPSWMTSKQPNNRQLNYVPAIPLVYMKPGTGKLALYKLQQALLINQIDAVTDRYYWDNSLAEYYNLEENKFISNPLTTFDQEQFDDAQYTVVDTVDFAVDTPFYLVNNSRASDLKRLGILDGYRGDINGKTLVFFKQENYTDLQDFENFQGWAQIIPQYDDQFDAGFETYNIVTGKEILDLLLAPVSPWAPAVSYNVGDLVEYNSITYVCVTAHIDYIFKNGFFAPITSTTVYQQAGIWRIVEDNMGFVQLEFVKEISYNPTTPYNSVRVRSGITHGGAIVSLVPAATLGAGYTVPGYINQADVITQTENGTVFDSSTTEFFDSTTDQYQELDQNAKYLVFKKQNIIDRGTVDV